MIKSETAGGVVVNKEGKILVVSQHGDSWSLPKGHIDTCETKLDAAAREIREESGIEKLEYVKSLGAYQRYRIGKNGKGEDKSELKIIYMFLFRAKQDKLKPIDPKNPEAKWVDKKDVSKLLTHKKDKEFFESVSHKLR